jgi:TonB family protein
MRLLFKTESFGRHRLACVAVSAALHLLILACIFYAERPRLLTATSKVAGTGERFAAHIYWPSQKNSAANDALGTGQSYKQVMERARKQFQLQARLHTKPKVKMKIKEAPIPLSHTPSVSVSEPSLAANQPQPAGSSNGSAFDSSSDDEIRVALPVVSSDPFVDKGELGGKQGDVIVEITIDDKGNIIAKQVVESFSPEIDNKVLAALQSWHFLPATRNGVPISSKQDVHYHFPRQQG